MNKKSFALSAVCLLLANVAMAVPRETPLPVEDGGIFAIAAACLVFGARVVQRKRNRK